MKSWKDTLISPECTILNAIKVIDSSDARVALVVTKESDLIGTITDGDIRRGILKGIPLTNDVSKVLNREPITALTDQQKSDYEQELAKHLIHQLPLINSTGKVEGLYLSSDLEKGKVKENPVVLMAGGLGSRLGELTNDCPKPMLKIGGRPILETIIRNFKEEGYRNFYISVNYKSEIIENYFKNGEDLGVEINYLRESQRMGTAGSLSLLAQDFDIPVIVMNGDILTSISINELLKFHIDTNAIATTCVREFNYQVPYGVVETDGTTIKSIKEKPTHKNFVSAGIYAVSPSLMRKIPENEFYDMPTLLNLAIGNGEKVSAFPIREYWLDIGHRDDFEKAHLEYNKNFE